MENQAEIKTIPSSVFVEKMDRHWIDELKNFSNPKLKETWKQIVETFNYHIQNHEIPDRAKECV
jgi:hypothetical protein